MPDALPYTLTSQDVLIISWALSHADYRTDQWIASMLRMEPYEMARHAMTLHQRLLREHDERSP